LTDNRFVSAEASALVRIVVVSHSASLASGVVELARQMAGDELHLGAVGGGPDGGLGTDADRVAEALRAADGGRGILVLADLGSALLTSEAAIEALGDELRGPVRISRGPLVEGAVVAAVQASIGEDLDAVLAAAEGARDLDKGGGA
jgi:dihydroxyacetone kinase phosphotransfer subunit